jgi:hypothetical protein
MPIGKFKKQKKKNGKPLQQGLPQISSEVNYQNFLEMPVSLVPAEFFGGNPGEFRELTFGTEQNMIGSLKMEQLIFDGSYLVGLQAAKVYLAISENLFEKTNLEVKKMVTNLYSNAPVGKIQYTFFGEKQSFFGKQFPRNTSTVSEWF